MVAVQHAKLVNNPMSNLWVGNQVYTQCMTKTENVFSAKTLSFKVSVNLIQEMPYFFKDQDKMGNFCRVPHTHHSWQDSDEKIKMWNVSHSDDYDWQSEGQTKVMTIKNISSSLRCQNTDKSIKIRIISI